MPLGVRLAPSAVDLLCGSKSVFTQTLQEKMQPLGKKLARAQLASCVWQKVILSRRIFGQLVLQKVRDLVVSFQKSSEGGQSLRDGLRQYSTTRW